MSTDAKIPEGKLASGSRPWSGLATRLFALVLIAILPALAIQAYNEITFKRSRETEVRTDALRLAKFAAGELDCIIDNGRTLLFALAHYPTVRNRDTKACSDFFAGLSKVFPQYLVMGATDLNSRIFCANLPIPSGIIAVDRPYFKEAIASNKFVVGEYMIGRLAHKPLLPLLLPFAGPDGHIAGVVYISLDIDCLARYFQSDREINKDATLAIADHNDIILVRLPDNADPDYHRASANLRRL